MWGLLNKHDRSIHVVSRKNYNYLLNAIHSYWNNGFGIGETVSMQMLQTVYYEMRSK